MPSADLIKALKTALRPRGILEGDILANRPVGLGRSDKIPGAYPVGVRLHGRGVHVLRICHAHGGGGDAWRPERQYPRHRYHADDVVLSLERMRAIISIDATQRVAVSRPAPRYSRCRKPPDAGGCCFGWTSAHRFNKFFSRGLRVFNEMVRAKSCVDKKCTLKMCLRRRSRRAGLTDVIGRIEVPLKGQAGTRQ